MFASIPTGFGRSRPKGVVFPGRQRKLLIAGLLVTGGLVPALYAQPTPVTLPARFSYAAKFLCGAPTAPTTSPPKEPIVKRGNYATVINIHNPYATEVLILKKVALAAPERFPNTLFIAPTKRYRDILRPDHAMSVDCEEIVNLLSLNGTPPAAGTVFLEGFLVIDSYFPTPAGTATAADVDVVTVTTTSAGPAAAVNDHEIVPVAGRKLAAGTWPF
jgi:hypothetical protein